MQELSQRPVQLSRPIEKGLSGDEFSAPDAKKSASKDHPSRVPRKSGKGKSVVVPVVMVRHRKHLFRCCEVMTRR